MNRLAGRKMRDISSKLCTRLRQGVILFNSGATEDEAEGKRGSGMGQEAQTE